MNLIEIMRNRRSVRNYTGEAIPEEKLTMIIQAGLLSPTGKNSKPWEFIVVRNKQTLEKMSGCRTGSANMLKGADCAIVVLGDTDKTDTTIEDGSIALANMHLIADSLGVGSCWIQGRLREASDGRSTEEYLRDILGYKENHQLIAVLSLGMPEKKPAGYELPDINNSEKVHFEKF